VKAPYEFGNDPMKIMCFEHEIRMKFDDRIMMLKLCIVVFFSHNCNGTFIFMSFLCLDMHTLFSFSLWFAFIFGVTQQVMFISLCVYYMKRNNWKF
jgi:hypothetical protein